MEIINIQCNVSCIILIMLGNILVFLNVKSCNLFIDNKCLNAMINDCMHARATNLDPPNILIGTRYVKAYLKNIG